MKKQLMENKFSLVFVGADYFSGRAVQSTSKLSSFKKRLLQGNSYEPNNC